MGRRRGLFRVSYFVAGLSKLNLVKFVPAGKGLELKDDAFQVDIALADKTVQLTVGAEEGTGYFATSKQMPGDTFVVGKALFEKFRVNRASFRK